MITYIVRVNCKTSYPDPQFLASKPELSPLSDIELFYPKGGIPSETLYGLRTSHLPAAKRFSLDEAVVIKRHLDSILTIKYPGISYASYAGASYAIDRVFITPQKRLVVLETIEPKEANRSSHKLLDLDDESLDKSLNEMFKTAVNKLTPQERFLLDVWIPK
jgi:hypothetical protein